MEETIKTIKEEREKDEEAYEPTKCEMPPKKKSVKIVDGFVIFDF